MKTKIKNEIIIWSLIIINAILLLSVEVYRAKIGYFTNGWLTFSSSVLYIFLFGLIAGYIINKILKRYK